MFTTLTILHSALRWLVLISLSYTIFISAKGYIQRRAFTKLDNAARHWTATIAHTQLLLGILLLTKSPTVSVFWKDRDFHSGNFDLTFFGLLHPLLMLCAILVLTVGSAVAKRTDEDRQRFRTILIYYTIALLLIFIAIPWPFSPLANRPYLR